MKKCLYCYKSLDNDATDFHVACSRAIFGQPYPPVLAYSESDIESLAFQVIQSQTVLTGVQAKVSLHLTGNPKEGRRFTIVGLWGGYILKPPTNLYPQLPEVEDLTMHLAEISGIKTAPHSLIRMASGNLAYITKRVDRTKKRKLSMEDMCQLTERLTEDKYHGSTEQIAKAILKYSSTPGLDLINYFEMVLFSFITGNADMHLKNFSLLEKPGLGMILSPAYDMVNTKLVNPADDEELALTLNGKKKKIKKQDFVIAMNSLKIDEKQQQNIFNKIVTSLPAWKNMINMSFLTEDFKQQYEAIVTERISRII